ncbi:hypothetical protein SKAU_G00415020 [Synaphobranchus kaupii]|uniref:Uncharacterized protein n=1 Tax=Synaphobranchus kaupii TaxID=118154 RepID=A0A9Q1IBF5_SYNKA|nr:hypothetical protein SKAU_G00415020 [Synaphobranchus kaupii]
MEEGLNDHSDRIVAIETACTALQTENKKLRDKVDDLENRSRRSNLVGPKPAAETQTRTPNGLGCFSYSSTVKHRIITRKRHQLYFRGHKVFFHEDVRCADLGKRQAAFKEVKSLLYKKSVRFALIYPARLRVLHDGEILFFDTPGKAREFYDLHWGE